MKFCKDCSNAVMSISYDYDYGCSVGETRDMVWGSLQRPWARDVREDEGRCGKDAKWFVQRPEAQPGPKPEGPKNILDPAPKPTLLQQLRNLFA